MINDKGWITDDSNLTNGEVWKLKQPLEYEVYRPKPETIETREAKHIVLTNTDMGADRERFAVFACTEDGYVKDFEKDVLAEGMQVKHVWWEFIDKHIVEINPFDLIRNIDRRGQTDSTTGEAQ